MLVFSYAVELDAADAGAEGYAALVREAVAAYRKRAACFLARGDEAAGRRDAKRADALEAKLAKADVKSAAAEVKPDLPGRVRVRNDWNEPVTLLIAGATHTLRSGETRELPTPAGSFPYEMRAGTHRSQATLEAGRGYVISPPPAAP